MRQTYQEKRYPKRVSKKKKRKRTYDYAYEDFGLNCDNVDRLISDFEKLRSLKKGSISFRNIKNIDLGLCLLYASLLEFHQDKIEFKTILLPRKRNIKGKFVAMGIPNLMHQKNFTCNNDGRIKVLKLNPSNLKEAEEHLMQINQELIVPYLQNKQKEMIRDLDKIFEELWNNITEHSKRQDSAVYVAREICDNSAKFAILDQGIGYRESVQAHFGQSDKVKDYWNEKFPQIMSKWSLITKKPIFKDIRE